MLSRTPLTLLRTSGVSALHRARKARNDEFYTRLEDIEAELRHYRAHFRGKTVHCNADDLCSSQFVRYFVDNFNSLGLECLLVTGFGVGAAGAAAIGLEVNRVRQERASIDDLIDDSSNRVWGLCGDATYSAGDFRSVECVALLQRADIVVTNPPFSLAREFLAMLIERRKSFLFVARATLITTTPGLEALKAGLVWARAGIELWFGTPAGGKLFRLGNGCWVTNLESSVRHQPVAAPGRYSDGYVRYDNFDAIDVPQLKLLCADYHGWMGVPITVLFGRPLEQFEITRVHHNLTLTKSGVTRGVFLRVIVRWKRCTSPLECVIGKLLPPQKEDRQC